MSIYNYLLSRNEEDYDLEVEAHFYGSCRGSRDSYGMREEPDEEAHWEIEDVNHNGEHFPITDREENEILDYLDGLQIERYYDE